MAIFGAASLVRLRAALATAFAAMLLVFPMAGSAGAADLTAESSCDPLSGASLETDLESSSCLLDEPTLQSNLTEEFPPQDPAPSQNNSVPTTSQQTGTPGQETSPVGSASGSPGLEAEKLNRAAPNPSRDYRPRRGSRTTVDLMEMLTRLGISERKLAEIVAPFPVLGPAAYGDDWGNPRYDPYFHLHEGIDVFAQRGTAVIASSSGMVTRMATGSGPGGTSLRLTTTDGTYYYYAHLDRFAPRLHQGQRVRAGEILGFVGTTGNAESGAPHLHFEIHPYGGAAVPPLPYLDRWLAEALATARSLQASVPKQVFSVMGDRVLEFVYRAGEAVPTKILNQPATGEPIATGWPVTLAVAVALSIWGRRRQIGLDRDGWGSREIIRTPDLGGSP